MGDVERENVNKGEISTVEVFLAQAFEESRYQRRVHHLIFTVAISLYSALLGLQIAYTDSFRHGSPLVVAIGFFVILPIYFSWFVIDRHATIAKLNISIANLSDRLAELTTGHSITDKDTVFGLPLESRRVFLALRYKEHVEDKKKHIVTVGKGHWFFLAVMFSLFVSNAVVFLGSDLP